MRQSNEESLKSGIICPSTSPLGVGFFFVSKKDKTLRQCIDFRGLNQITVKNKYPLPLINSVYEKLQDAKIFTKLDLCNSYHLVRIRKGDKWKTTFKIPLGHFEYLVMPSGLTTPPAVFQNCINSVLRDFLNIFVFIYLDEILIFSKESAKHTDHVKAPETPRKQHVCKSGEMGVSYVFHHFSWIYFWGRTSSSWPKEDESSCRVAHNTGL